MTKFKMLGLDFSASLQPQYRTWTVEDSPDYDAEQYTGLKSSDEPLLNVSAYIVPGQDTVANFNFPIPTSWSMAKKTVPSNVEGAQFAIIDGYAYLFGGVNSNNILRATLENPMDWTIVGTLPSILYGSQVAVLSDRVYLFGGHDDGYALSKIYSASLSDPLTWTDHGSLLPEALYYSHLGIIDDSIYLFSGHLETGLSDRIYRCSTSDPLTWETIQFILPMKIYGSQFAILDGYAYLFGGALDNNTYTDKIFSASLDDPLIWRWVQVLPQRVAFGQFVPVGNRGYLITPTYSKVPNTSFCKILRCELSDPTSWVDTQKTLPCHINNSQLGIIYDRIFLFGGNGSTFIVANDNMVKYKFGIPSIYQYGNTTRTLVEATPTKTDLFRVLGMPYWKTDYGA